METLLETNNLSKTYVVGKDNQINVLKNVNIKINEGDLVSVMGPSGSGKSTLLHNISGMDRLTSGNVKFCGEELVNLSEAELSSLRLKKMGFIFQQIHLLKNLNIFDNIILPAYSAKMESRNKINKRAKKLMKQTGIADLIHNDITQASGGQLQRVAICRALINQPNIIFGDEPTGALNSKYANEIMELLAEINQTGTAVLLVTHDIKVAVKTERVVYMLDGSIVGEIKLGRYLRENHDMEVREKKLSTWLMQMGF
ncbi:ABC transporter ATP-binding protein [Virgibacillus sp. C22-A2]|uniref:ABC transporter ATP-binding protein n=1 Tax=Virgibacillus tibetensis TaxID=3042313 RepID=A0ABU6KE48_9BACI|nr:ABC transporter ATP-binding protein [Virgibacillus sp. C22-A2]